MQKYKYSALVLYSDNYFLKSEKSRERTKHLNCTFQNLFIEYVSVYLEYATYLGFTRMIFNLDLKIKLECFQFHFPDSLSQMYELKRFTMVNNRNVSLSNHWHFTTDIFFGLTVDNKKFATHGEFCASDHNTDGESCYEAADSIRGCCIADFIERIDKHSSYIHTNTCAGNILRLNAYGNYLLDIKGYDEDAQNHYIRFCDEYLERLNRPDAVMHTDLPRPGSSTSFAP